MQLNINREAINVHRANLEKFGRSVFPRAIRNTLNNAAFDVKKNTMPRSADKAFVNREKNFFKANSTVKRADGFNVNQMEAKVGFAPQRVKHNQAVEDLEQQEIGGNIKGRSFIPLRGARVSNSPAKIVRNNARLKSIPNLLRTNRAQGKSKGQRFIKTVIEAKKTNSPFLHDDTVFKVNSISKGMKFSLTAIYSYKRGRSVNVDSTGFMQRASFESALKMPDYFYQNAHVEYKRFMK